MTVLAVMSDSGSFNTVFPVAQILSGEDSTLFIISEGRAAENKFREVIREGILDSCSWEQVGLDDLPLCAPSVVVTGMSCDNVEYRVAARFKDRCPIVTIPDQWSTPLFAGGWNEIGHIFPDVVCVNDEVGRKAVRYWGFNGLVVKTGWPALDQHSVAVKTFESGRREVRKMLQLQGLEPEKKLVLFVGQGTRENTEALMELLSIVSGLKTEVVVAVREHPNMRRDSPLEAEFWDEVMGKNKDCLADTSGFSSTQVLSAADAVISDFSTMLTEAVIAGIPVISVLYPGGPIVRQFFEWEWADRTFPLAALECCLVASNRYELRQLLDEALAGENLGYFEKVKNVFRLDGQNSWRVAAVVKRFM